MGVSLERVQFKFASIIGELCSEPVVLSQFAVWLDLRLAEYKSKGAISLDCSGEKPDPSWLKGLRISVPMSAAGAKRVLGSRITPRATGFSRGGMYSRSSAFHRRNVNSNSKLSHNVQDRSQHDGSDRLSSNENMDNMLGSSSQDNSDDVVVVVKDEPEGSSVYPVSLHQHSGNEAESRKRSAIDSISGGQEEDDSSPYKIPKTANEDSSQNQSLMSVLGTSIDDQSTDVSTVGNESLQNQMDYSVNLQDQKGDSTGYEWGNNSADYSHAVNVSSSSTYSQDQPSTSSATLSSINKTEGFTDVELASQNVGAGWSPGPGQRPISSSSLSTFHDRRVADEDRKQRNTKRRAMLFKTGKPSSTVNDIIGAVNAFERWLWDKEIDEKREMSDIPIKVLDEYLVEYFTILKGRYGQNYSPESFNAQRSRLDAFLRDSGYPVSITSNPQFHASQTSFKARKASLIKHYEKRQQQFEGI